MTSKLKYYTRQTFIIDKIYEQIEGKGKLLMPSYICKDVYSSITKKNFKWKVENYNINSRLQPIIKRENYPENTEYGILYLCNYFGLLKINEEEFKKWELVFNVIILDNSHVYSDSTLKEVEYSLYSPRKFINFRYGSYYNTTNIAKTDKEKTRLRLGIREASFEYARNLRILQKIKKLLWAEKERSKKEEKLPKNKTVPLIYLWYLKSELRTKKMRRIRYYSIKYLRLLRNKIDSSDYEIYRYKYLKDKNYIPWLIPLKKEQLDKTYLKVDTCKIGRESKRIWEKKTYNID